MLLFTKHVTFRKRHSAIALWWRVPSSWSLLALSISLPLQRLFFSSITACLLFSVKDWITKTTKKKAVQQSGKTEPDVFNQVRRRVVTCLPQANFPHFASSVAVQSFEFLLQVNSSFFCGRYSGFGYHKLQLAPSDSDSLKWDATRKERRDMSALTETQKWKLDQPHYFGSLHFFRKKPLRNLQFNTQVVYPPANIYRCSETRDHILNQGSLEGLVFLACRDAEGSTSITLEGAAVESKEEYTGHQTSQMRDNKNVKR